mmetsp:Transcript_30885/g.104840  ORF Transcript_30885/g.104840 Transcript_30885/m.104840 type:complete len:83 (+) Transcript_30885:38-286(+)
MSGDAYHLKLQAELGVNVARKEAWQFELESLSKVPQTAAQAADSISELVKKEYANDPFMTGYAGPENPFMKPPKSGGGCEII